RPPNPDAAPTDSWCSLKVVAALGRHTSLQWLVQARGAPAGPLFLRVLSENRPKEQFAPAQRDGCGRIRSRHTNTTRQRGPRYRRRPSLARRVSVPLHAPSHRTTCTSPGPCTPVTRRSSMSPVLLGPVISVRHDGNGRPALGPTVANRSNK